jgi:ribosomal protein S18 acetylase RimI-like enzyme
MFLFITPDLVEQRIEEFMEIAADIPGEYWERQHYLHSLPGKWDFSIAEEDERTGDLLSFLIASQKDVSVHIHKLAVRKEFRSKGIGLRLLRKFEQRIRSHATKRIISLYVDKGNERAIRFYSNNGYTFSEAKESMNLYIKKLEYTVAIHQPNFLPWLGYFHKIAHCDHFIFLDHVNNNPGAALYTKRVSIVCNSEAHWLTIPLEKSTDGPFQPIYRMRIASRIPFAEKQLRTVEMNYSKAPYFRDFFSLYSKYYIHQSDLVAERNKDLILAICESIGLPFSYSVSSAMGFTSTSNELLIELIKSVGGTQYLHGSYAVSERGYQQNDLFEKEGIKLLPQQFTHPEYRQINNKSHFIPGTTILDALMNVGASDVLNFIT